MTMLAHHMEDFESDSRWFQSHLDELRKEYENEFVAVEKGDVVTAGKTVDSVVRKLRKMKKDPRYILIEFVPERGKKFLL